MDVRKVWLAWGIFRNTTFSSTERKFRDATNSSDWVGTGPSAVKSIPITRVMTGNINPEKLMNHLDERMKT